MQFPNNTHIITKTMMVPKQPPPNFFAPYPAIKPLKILFMMFLFWLEYKVEKIA